MTKEQAEAIVDATVHGIKYERLRVVNLIKDTALSDAHNNCYSEDQCWCASWLELTDLVLGVSNE